MYGITVSRFTYYPPHVITIEHHIAYSHLGNKGGPFLCDTLSPPPVLHSHVGAFLHYGNRMRTLRLKEFMTSTFQRPTMNRLPTPDLGSMLNRLERSISHQNLRSKESRHYIFRFSGLIVMYVALIYRFTTLMTLQWLSRLVSVVTYYPHVKDFSIRSDLMGASNASHAFRLSIDLLYQYRGGTTGSLERLCFSFKCLDNLEVDCRRKQEAGAVNGSCDVRTRGHWKSGF